MWNIRTIEKTIKIIQSLKKLRKSNVTIAFDFIPLQVIQNYNCATTLVCHTYDVFIFHGAQMLCPQ